MFGFVYFVINSPRMKKENPFILESTLKLSQQTGSGQLIIEQYVVMVNLWFQCVRSSYQFTIYLVSYSFIQWDCPALGKITGEKKSTTFSFENVTFKFISDGSFFFSFGVFYSIPFLRKSRFFKAVPHHSQRLATCVPRFLSFVIISISEWKGSFCLISFFVFILE